MSVLRLLPLVAVLGLPSAAQSEPPSVVADILPVHSLAAQVMKGVATPELLLPPGANPHAYALKPSNAKALSQADLIFWIGPDLLPWMADTLPRLAPSAHSAALMHVPGATVLDNRAKAIFGEDDDHVGHEEHSDHDDHADHEEHNEHENHDDHAKHDDHGDHDDHAHDHGRQDPHVWLDPENARVWLSVMAEELSELDPENADTYRANAEAARANLGSLITQISADLPTMEGTGIFVFHDAYHYFENRFGLNIAGAITDSDDAAPGAARIDDLHHAAERFSSICVLAKPQFSKRLVKTVTDGQGTVQLIDPLGAHIPAGPDHYQTVLTEIAAAISACEK